MCPLVEQALGAQGVLLWLLCVDGGFSPPRSPHKCSSQMGVFGTAAEEDSSGNAWELEL